LREERQEPIAGEAPLVSNVARSMRDRDLKDRLCEIDSDGRMLHLDSSCRGPQEAVSPGTMMPHRQEESIPSPVGAVAPAPLLSPLTFDISGY
jgi:hypothetical protein